MSEPKLSERMRKATLRGIAEDYMLVGEWADEVAALEARLSKMEQERDEWHAVADRHLKEKNALVVAEALAGESEA